MTIFVITQGLDEQQYVGHDAVFVFNLTCRTPYAAPVRDVFLIP